MSHGNQLESVHAKSDHASQTARQKYLIFYLGEDAFGIPLFSVKEVIGLKTITPVPQAPKFFRGLINLRGMIISVIDLRQKIGLAAADHVAKKTCAIIVEIDGLTVGVIVDDVREVANISLEDVESNCEVKSEVRRELITSVAKRDDDKLTVLIDLKGVLTPADMALLASCMKSSIQAA